MDTDTLTDELVCAVIEHGFNPKALDPDDLWDRRAAESAVERVLAQLPRLYNVHRVVRGRVRCQPCGWAVVRRKAER